MNPLRGLVGSAVVLAAVGGLSITMAGCEGPQAISEGEADPAQVLKPSADAKDDSLAALGIALQQNSDSGAVSYLGGHIAADIQDAEAVRQLVLSRLAGVYKLTAGADLSVVADGRDERGHRYVRLQQLFGGTH